MLLLKFLWKSAKFPWFWWNFCEHWRNFHDFSENWRNFDDFLWKSANSPCFWRNFCENWQNSLNFGEILLKSTKSMIFVKYQWKSAYFSWFWWNCRVLPRYRFPIPIPTRGPIPIPIPTRTIRYDTDTIPYPLKRYDTAFWYRIGNPDCNHGSRKYGILKVVRETTLLKENFL